MKKFRAGSNERLMADKLKEIADTDHPGVTHLDFVGTTITEENIDAVIASLQSGEFESDTSMRVLGDFGPELHTSGQGTKKKA